MASPRPIDAPVTIAVDIAILLDLEGFRPPVAAGSRQ
jgi:hypothetical protein